MGHVIESDSQPQCTHAHFVVVPRQRDRSRACSAKRIAIFREGWRVICGRSSFNFIRWTNGKVSVSPSTIFCQIRLTRRSVQFPARFVFFALAMNFTLQSRGNLFR